MQTEEDPSETVLMRIKPLYTSSATSIKIWTNNRNYAKI